MGSYDDFTTVDDLETEDRIDSRDLRDLMATLAERLQDPGEDADDKADMRELLDALKALQEETEGYSGDLWRDGVFFIAKYDFEEYAREYADDIGAINGDAAWPTNHIDWEAAAEDLAGDYAECTIGGRTYLYR